MIYQIQLGLYISYTGEIVASKGRAGNVHQKCNSRDPEELQYL